MEHVTNSLQARSAAEGEPLEALKAAVEELRRHGIRARIRPDHRGMPEIYIDYDDLDAVDRLCAEGRLSETAKRLLC